MACSNLAAQLSADPFGASSGAPIWQAPAEVVSTLNTAQFDVAIAELEASNAHSEALLAKCKWCGTDEQVGEATRILQGRERHGYLTDDLESRRQVLAESIRSTWRTKRFDSNLVLQREDTDDWSEVNRPGC